MVLGLLWCNNGIAKEIKTIFGFSLKVPNNYYYKGSVLEKDKGIPDEVINAITNPNLVWFFQKSLDPNKNAININMQANVSIDSMKQSEIPGLCQAMKNIKIKRYNNPNLQVHFCKLEIAPNSKKVFSFISDGRFKDTLTMQQSFDHNKNAVTFTIFCEKKNCDQIHTDANEIMISIK